MENNTSAKHLDSGKVPLHFVLGMAGLDDVARVGEFGAKKYGQYNWKNGMQWMKLLGSCTRHLVSFIRGEDNDPESGLPHLAHFIYDGLMLMEYKQEYSHLDDRYKPAERSVFGDSGFGDLYHAQHQEDNSEVPF